MTMEDRPSLVCLGHSMVDRLTVKRLRRYDTLADFGQGIGTQASRHRCPAGFTFTDPGDEAISARTVFKAIDIRAVARQLKTLLVHITNRRCGLLRVTTTVRVELELRIVEYAIGRGVIPFVVGIEGCELGGLRDVTCSLRADLGLEDIYPHASGSASVGMEVGIPISGAERPT